MLFLSSLALFFLDHRSQIKKKVQHLDPENHDLFLLLDGEWLQVLT